MYLHTEPVLGPALRRALQGSTLPISATADRHDPQWIPVTRLLDPDYFAELAERYSRARGLPALAPGLGCALQHYTGRAVSILIPLWCADGTLMDPDHRRWWARIDATGATTSVASPGLRLRGRDRDPAALVTVLREHTEPLLAACLAAGNATRRFALGCQIASIAGGFALAFRSVAPHRRDEVEAAARQVLGELDHPRATATLLRLRYLGSAPEASNWQSEDQSSSERLSHDRHSCCLMRLGTESSECGTCPRLSEVERRRRQRAAQPRVHIDLSAIA